MADMIGFVDPSQIGALGCGNPTERSRCLANRFNNAKKGQLFLLPYNAGLVNFPLICLITCINHLITNSALLELTYNLVSLFLKKFLSKHWMLTVVNPEEEIVYFMDPLKRRLVGGEWHTVVEK
jgi:hypothetical protein